MKIVYVCSPDWEDYLFTSIQSVLSTGTSFDEIVIYCVGDKPDYWNFDGVSIRAIEVPSVNDKLWFFNKIHICNVDANRVVYLDADTVVLSPLDRLFDNMSGDIGGRRATQSTLTSWDKELWKNCLEGYDSSTTFPYLCAGVLLFDNGSHRNIKVSWPGIAYDICINANDEEPPIYNSRKYYEQAALSIASAAEGLKPHLFSSKQISHGWEGDSYESTVYHTGNGQFFRHAYIINEKSNFMSNINEMPRYNLYLKHMKKNLPKRAKNLVSKFFFR